MESAKFPSGRQRFCLTANPFKDEIESLDHRLETQLREQTRKQVWSTQMKKVIRGPTDLAK
ncbi:hypothetical protein ACJMK2_006657, partial [Sinanodonta woodiana]